ncbi:MAG TPA: BBP7 family outer membrane beta-barrel protein, partial [Gemmataceae bacterium]
LFGGMWLDGGTNWGVDGSYAQLFQKADTFAIASSGVPVIGRGFVDAGVGKESFLRYTTPDGLSTGYIAVDAPVKMYTFDGNIRVRGTTVFMDETDYLAGLRYLNLKDSVTINSAIAIRPAPGATPFVIASNESFRARNQFYGSQIGFDSHSQYKCWTLDVTAKLASGWVHQEVDIAGSASQQFGSAVQVFPNESILYVQPTNVGRYSRDRFAVVPELLLKLGYQITPHIRATVGYDILTVSSVERSGAAINPAVNPEFTRFIVVHKNSGLHEPTFHFSGTDFWAQGITFGLTMTY